MKKLLTILLFFPFLLHAQGGGYPSFANIQAPGTGPTVFVTYGFFNTYTTVAGTPSTTNANPFSLTALTGSNGAINIPAPFEGSINNGENYFSGSSAFTELATGNYTLQLRVAASATAGSYGPDTVKFTATGAPTQYCVVTATVSSSGSPTNTVSTSSLTIPSTPSGTPSASNSFILNGVRLTLADTVKTGASFGISLDNLNFSNLVIVPESGGTVSSVGVYTRLIAGAAPGSYSGYDTITSAGAAPVVVSLAGTVTSAAVPDTFYFNFDSTHTVTARNWTNITGSLWKTAKMGTVTGNVSTITWQTFTKAQGGWFGYASAGDTTTVAASNGYTSNTLPVPSAATLDYEFSYETGGDYNPANYKFEVSGLIPSHTYTITMSASSISLGFNMTTEYRVLGATVIGPTTINILQNANTQFNQPVTTDSNGRLFFYANPATGNNLAGLAYITIIG